MSGLKRSIQQIFASGPSNSPSPVSATDVQVYDVTEGTLEVDLSSMEWLRTAPVWMTLAERLLLFSLVYGLRPQRYLEIGTLHGGSAMLACHAMDMTESSGRITCVDPEPRISDEDWTRISHRAHLVEGLSPQILPQAVEVAGGPFDFVLIDGDHSYEGVKRDAVGVMPYVADGAYLLFHDSFFPEIGQALDDFSSKNRNRVIDFGVLTREVTMQEVSSGDAVQWGGLRMMQVRGQA